MIDKRCLHNCQESTYYQRMLSIFGIMGRKATYMMLKMRHMACYLSGNDKKTLFEAANDQLEMGKFQNRCSHLETQNIGVENQ